QMRLDRLFEFELELVHARIARARRAYRILVDRARQRVPLFGRPRHLRAGQPQHHAAELHQNFVERPIHSCELIHRTTPLSKEKGVMSSAPARSACASLWITRSKRGTIPEARAL